MKIAQVTTVFPPYKGGMGQVPYYYASELHKLGQTVEVLTPDYNLGREQADFVINYLKSWFSWGLGALCPQLIWQLKKYDVIQLHYPAYGMALPVLIWKKLFGQKKKLVIFYHMDNRASGFLGLIFVIYRKLFLNLILKSADKILVSSFDYAEHSDIKNLFKNQREKFQELPFGVTDKYQPKEKNWQLLEEYKINKDNEIILFVGGLRREHYFKGVEYLIKAVALLKNSDWQLVLVGKGELTTSYQKLASELNLSNQVTFVGYQPDALMPDWYNLASVTVLPSIDQSEAFGMVLVEAQACGCPVVASDLPGVRTTLEIGKTGYLSEIGDSVDIAAKLSSIIYDQKLHQHFSQNAVANVQKKYLWSQIVKRLLQIYQS